MAFAARLISSDFPGSGLLNLRSGPADVDHRERVYGIKYLTCPPDGARSEPAPLPGMHPDSPGRAHA
jgi:hypothetical protein